MCVSSLTIPSPRPISGVIDVLDIVKLYYILEPHVNLKHVPEGLDEDVKPPTVVSP